MLLERDAALRTQRAATAELRTALDGLLKDSVQLLASRTLAVAKEGILRALNHVLLFAVALAVILLAAMAAAVLYARVSVVMLVRKLRVALAAVHDTGNLSVRVDSQGAPEVREISG